MDEDSEDSEDGLMGHVNCSLGESSWWELTLACRRSHQAHFCCSEGAQALKPPSLWTEQAQMFLTFQMFLACQTQCFDSNKEAFSCEILQ